MFQRDHLVLNAIAEIKAEQNDGHDGARSACKRWFGNGSASAAVSP